MELTINGERYQFEFNFGFLKRINKKVKMPVENTKMEKNAGLSFAVASLMDGDVEELVEVLDIANEGQNPRVTPMLIEQMIDDPSTDIDKLFEDVLDFLGRSNSCKKTVETLRTEVAKRQDL